MSLDGDEKQATQCYLAGDWVTAARLCKAILNVRPRNVQALRIQACLAGVAGSYSHALRLIERAIVEEPHRVDLRHEELRYLMEGGYLAKAVDAAERLCADFPGAQSEMQCAFSLMLAGRNEEGFRRYDARIPEKLATSHRGLRSIDQWHGETLEGTLLVVPDGGAGDIIQFARYLPAAIARCRRVILKCPKSLRRLLACIEGLEFTTEQDLGLKPPAHDAWVLMMSLPNCVGLDGDVPIPYLRSPGGITVGADLRGPFRPRVGVVWGGNPQQGRDQQRSMPPVMAHRLLAFDKVEWHVLQQGYHLMLFGSFGKLPHCVEHAHELRDWYDTACLMQSLDLVVSVCSGPIHLAAALGRPTWGMLAKTPEWRWGIGTSTPWYPHMRLFRQPFATHWAPVIDQVHENLVHTFRLQGAAA